MKAALANVALGLLFVGTIESLPTSLESYITQLASGKAWIKDTQKPLVVVGAGQRCEDAPGIGFELTATYATASIKYRNGTTIDVGKIDGDFKYKNTMLGLLEKIPPFEPPFLDALDNTKWEDEQALRTARKRWGLPATEDIAILASLLYELKLATESKTGLPVTRAAIGIPYLPHLSKGDIEEAFQEASITKLESPKYDTKGITSINTAYVGMGYGLCTDWKDMTGCKDQEMEMDPTGVLVVSLNEDSLVITWVVMLAYLNTNRRSWTFQDLGYQSHTTPNYWKNVAEKIVQVGSINTVSRTGKIEQIVVMGECGEEKEFLDSLWFALNRLADEFDKFDGKAADIYAGLQVSSFNALYLGARGAAQLAMMWQGDVQDCVEDFPKAEPVDLIEEEPPFTITVTVAVGKSKAEGGAVDVMPITDLESWGVDTELMGHAIKQLEDDAGDRAWKIDAKYVVGKAVELSGTVYGVVPGKMEEPELGRAA